MKDYSYYAQPASSFDKNAFTTVFAYRAGVVIWESTFAQYDLVKTTEFFCKAIIERVVDHASLNAAREAASKYRTSLELEFKNDLFEYHGVTANTKRHDCFKLAWDKQHANGYGSVAEFFEELVQLIT